MLLGEHEHSLDDKNRVTLPARFRQAFADGVFVARGIDPCLLVFPPEGWHRLVEGQMELPSGQPGVPPTLARVHVLAPPLVQFAKVTIAKKARYEFDLDAIQRTGAMTPAMAEFLKSVARGRLTFVASGPTGAGKTTLLQAMSHNFDQTDRLIQLMWRPLCIAALNTPPERASAQIFLNVLRDSLGARRVASARRRSAVANARR